MSRMKFWPAIRHVRWAIACYRVHRFAWQMGQMGLGLGHPNESDLRILDLIWLGKA